MQAQENQQLEEVPNTTTSKDASDVASCLSTPRVLPWTADYFDRLLPYSASPAITEVIHNTLDVLGDLGRMGWFSNSL